jgi:hypothetical protein
MRVVQRPICHCENGTALGRLASAGREFFVVQFGRLKTALGGAGKVLVMRQLRVRVLPPAGSPIKKRFGGEGKDGFGSPFLH